MKRKHNVLFLTAAAAMTAAGFVSCSGDECIARNEKLVRIDNIPALFHHECADAVNLAQLIDEGVFAVRGYTRDGSDRVEFHFSGDARFADSSNHLVWEEEAIEWLHSHHDYKIVAVWPAHGEVAMGSDGNVTVSGHVLYAETPWLSRGADPGDDLFLHFHP